ncbi:MAG: sugar ABC transporter permease [Spirochaetaceae bacterium]|jgi:multiple sugar transport system permease protein|nr:sugar ABC transporter permease [Spirochaetaceae bacterium]
MRTQKIAFVFLAPWLIGITAFSLAPMLMSLWFSFTNSNMFNVPDWIGFANYTALFKDPRFLRSLGITARYVLFGVPLQLGFALFLASILNHKVPGFQLFRGIYYVPSLLGGSVAVALLWRQIFGLEGILNKGLSFLGFTRFAEVSWMNDPATAVYTLVALLVWQFGSCMVIFVAGIQNIPETLYEAAEIDGAGRIARFFSITFPMLTPIIFFNLIMQIISAFQAFTPAFIISRGTGGFRDSILFYTLYLYRQGFVEYKMGYASAMAWFLLLIIGAITALLFATSRLWVYYDE